MKKFIVFLFVVFIAGSIGLLLVKQPGYFMFVVSDHMLRMPLWLGVLFILAIIILFLILIWAIKFVFRMPIRWSLFFRKRKRVKALLILKKGMKALANNNYQIAVKLFSDENVFKPLKIEEEARLFYFRSLFNTGANKQEILEEMDNANEKMLKLPEFWCLKSELLAALGDLSNSTVTLEHSRELFPKFTPIYQALIRNQLKLKHYSDLSGLLEMIRINKIFTSIERYDLQVEIYTAWLKDIQISSQLAFGQLWEKIPRNIKKNYQIQKAHIGALFAFQFTQKANNLIKKMLNTSWDNELINLYVGNNKTTAKQVFEDVKMWQEKYHVNSDNVEQLELLVKLAVNADANDVAQNYLEKILKIEPSIKVYSMLADISDKQGRHTREDLYKQKVLDMVRKGEFNGLC